MNILSSIYASNIHVKLISVTVNLYCQNVILPTELHTHVDRGIKMVTSGNLILKPQAFQHL